MALVNNSTEASIEKIGGITQLSCLQIKAAIDSGESQFNRLSGHFTELVRVEQQISEKLKDGHSVSALMAELRALINVTTVEFQFFDRFKQKLEHAIEPLQNWSVNGIIVDLNDPEFIQNYSTQEEIDLYNALMKSGSIELALNQRPTMKTAEEGDVELF